MMILFLFTSFFAFAQTPVHWNHILEVADKHEFYQNHENITKPKESWQTLFSLVYIDSDLSRIKDCVFYKVPGKETGTLKIKTIPAGESCDSQLLNPGDREIQNIKNLQFAIYEKEVSLNLGLQDFKTQKWEASLQSSFKKPEPSMNMSSARFKSPDIIFLAPKSSLKVNKESFLKDKTLCHDVNEECQEVSPSRCSQCERDWYEVPNGCATGPKYCGTYRCGNKGEPACRRGIKWQKKEEKSDCRTDSSFAYCSKGVQVVCEGQKAFCR